MNNYQTISILMNCYNGDEYLTEALDSILAQTYAHWNLIFVDNKSTDRSKEVVNSYLPDKRIIYLETSYHMKLGEAREFGLTKCQGDYLCFLDTDDYWLPDKLDRQITLMKENPDVLISYTGYKNIDENGKILKAYKLKHQKGDLFGKNISRYEVNFQTVMISNKAFAKVSKPFFDPALSYSPDHNLVMRILAQGEGLSIPDVLVGYRVRSGSLSTKTIALWGVEMEYTYKQLDELGYLSAKTTSRQRKNASAMVDYQKAEYLISEKDYIGARKAVIRHCFRHPRYYLSLLAKSYLLKYYDGVFKTCEWM